MSHDLWESDTPPTPSRLDLTMLKVQTAGKVAHDQSIEFHPTNTLHTGGFCRACSETYLALQIFIGLRNPKPHVQTEFSDSERCTLTEPHEPHDWYYQRQAFDGPTRGNYLCRGIDPDLGSTT